MSRKAVPTHSFALVVVRLGHRFLLVHEKKHGQLWYLPAGRVEPGESFAQAAIRETEEEAGIPIVLDGILRIQHSPRLDGQRLRVIFCAHPAGDTPPKSEPDEETLGARWVALEELDDLPLRGAEVRELFSYVEQGGAVFPLSLLADEHAPLPPLS